MQYTTEIHIEHRLDAQAVMATAKNRVVAVVACIVCAPILAGSMWNLVETVHTFVAAKGASSLVPALTQDASVSVLTVLALVGFPAGLWMLWRLARPAVHAVLPVHHNPFLRARLSKDGGVGVYAYAFDDDGFTVSAPNGEKTHRWADFGRVRETSLSFLLMHRRNGNRCNIIPKRDARTDRELRSLLSSRIAA